MYDNNANTQDNANIQISADILNLLVIQGEVDDFDTVMEQLRSDYAADADAAKDCDPGFVVPASLPATCAGGEAEAVGDPVELAEAPAVPQRWCTGAAELLASS